MSEIEIIKNYRNCILWANYQSQPTGGVMTYLVCTPPNTTPDEAREYQVLPALFLSGKSIEDCKSKVSKHGHAVIMRNFLSAY